MKIFLILTLITTPYVHAGFGDLVSKTKDIGTLGVNVGKGIIEKVPELIPTPENL